MLDTHTEGQVNRAQVKIIRAGQRIAHIAKTTKTGNGSI